MIANKFGNIRTDVILRGVPVSLRSSIEYAELIAVEDALQALFEQTAHSRRANVVLATDSQCVLRWIMGRNYIKDTQALQIVQNIHEWIRKMNTKTFHIIWVLQIGNKRREDMLEIQYEEWTMSSLLFPMEQELITIKEGKERKSVLKRRVNILYQSASSRTK